MSIAADVADFYQTIAPRLDRLERGLRAAPTVLVNGTWVRDLPATVARATPPGRIQVPVAVYVPRILDLTDSLIWRRLRVRKRDLTVVPDWTALDASNRPQAYELPQAIGELAYHAGLGGILYPSAHATLGVNLVIFPARLVTVGGHLHAENPITGAAQSLP